MITLTEAMISAIIRVLSRKDWLIPESFVRPSYMTIAGLPEGFIWAYFLNTSDTISAYTLRPSRSRRNCKQEDKYDNGGICGQASTLRALLKLLSRPAVAMTGLNGRQRPSQK